MIQYNIPSSSGLEILVHQGVIDGGQFKKLFGVPYIVLPSTFFGQLSGLKYFIPYSFTLETSDVAVPVAVGVWVWVVVGVLVNVIVGVGVTVAVFVGVGVWVGVAEGVLVGVDVGAGVDVGVGVGTLAHVYIVVHSVQLV